MEQSIPAFGRWRRELVRNAGGAVTALAVGARDGAPAVVRSPSRRRLRRFLRNRPAAVSAVVVIVLLLAAIVGPLFAQDPTLVNLNNPLANPSGAHLLGTDDLGRDLFARVLDGGRVSFIVAFCATAIAVIPAGIFGVLAGYTRGIFDEIISRIFDILLAIPVLLLAIVIVSALGPSLSSLIVAIGISDIPRYGRLFRALTLEAKEREYVRSALVLGYSAPRVMIKHILPNIYLPVMIIATGNLGKVALAEASLSYLGVGVQPPQASWGNIISEGQPYLQYHPILALAPGIALSALTLAFSFVGDGLRDAFDVRDQAAG
jgi:ABC-type dipeptide/oligopeptide/nickel transport system permease subunit